MTLLKFLAACLVASLSLCLPACGSEAPADATSPAAAASVPVGEFPDVPTADDPMTAAGFDVSSRTVEVFLRSDASQRDVARVGETIASFPEVEVYTFVSKYDALAEFREKLGSQADEILDDLPTNPLPASYRMLVRERGDVMAVARRFFDDERIDNSPGTRDGVRFMTDGVYEMYRDEFE